MRSTLVNETGNNNVYTEGTKKLTYSKHFMTRISILIIASFLTAFIYSNSVQADFENSYKQAVQLYNNRRFTEALPLFQKATQENSKSVNAQYYLANCYYNLGHRPEALEAYWTVINHFPESPTTQQATVFLQQVAPDYLVEKQKEMASVSDQTKSQTVQKQITGRVCEYTADDLCVVLRATSDRLDCPPTFVSLMKNAFNQFPRSLRNMLGSHSVKIYLTPSSIEENPMLCNTQPSGYDDGMTYKNCGGFCSGRKVVVCAYQFKRDESGWEPTSDYVNTLRHETGHEIDNLLGRVSQQETYKHAYLLDVGAMDDSVRNELSYFTQKAGRGPSESFAEIVCIILGGS